MQLYGSTRLTETVLTPPLKCDAEVLLGDLTQDSSIGSNDANPLESATRAGLCHSRPKLTSAGPLHQRETRLPPLEKPENLFRFSALGWSRSFDWPARCTEIALDKGSLIDVAYRLKTRATLNSQDFELELVDIQIA